MKRLFTIFLIALLARSCEYEQYPMVLEYAIHFQDGSCSTYQYYFMGNDNAKAFIDFGSILKNSQYLRLSRFGSGYDPFSIVQTSGQIEIVSIKRKENSHE